MSATTLRSESGLSLIEMLFSTTMTAIILGVLLTLSTSLRSLSTDQTEVLEMDLNLRAALEFVARDLHLAGYGMRNVRYASDHGVIFPNADASDTFTTNAITLWHNPSDNRATVVAAMPLASSPIVVDAVTGFAEGDRVLIIGPGNDGVVHRDWFVVTHVEDGAGAGENHLEHEPPANPAELSTRYQAGAVVLPITEVTYRAATDDAGRPVLLRRENGGVESAVAQNVNLASFVYLDRANPANALTAIDTPAERRAIRSVRLDLRGQTEKRSRVTHRLRQLTLTTEVSPRNLEGGP